VQSIFVAESFRKINTERELIKMKAMKTKLQVLALSLFVALALSASGEVAQVQYEVIYNPATCLYEAHAHVVGASLTFPTTIPFPSKFTVVVPAAISNSPFTVVQSVNPPGLSWSQSNSIYAPAAAPNSDFHAFTISGGGGPNAYPVFTVGTDILLFKFSVPHVGCEEGIRCYINGTDPNSAQPGMGGIDFTQAFKTYQPGIPSGGNRYQSNIGNPVSLPKPAAISSKTIACDGSTLYLSSAGSTTLGCDNTLTYSWTGTGGYQSTTQNPSVSPFAAPGTYTVSIKDHNGCTNTSAVVLTAPFEVLSLAATATPVSNGPSTGAVDVAVSGGIAGYTYLWNNGLTTASITGLPAGIYTVTVTDANACSAIASAEVTESATVVISGFVLYDDNANGGINGVTVTLRNSSDAVVGTTLTINDAVSGLPGYYSFSNIPDGTGYKVGGSFTGAWGGNNATDDLIVKMNTVGTYPLNGLRNQVADVNGTGTVTALDALYITLRTVGTITAYPAGDWKISEKTFALSGTPVTENLTALCEGDVNGSYEPGGSKSTTYFPVVEDDVMSIGAGGSFVYNLRSNNAADLGAITLYLGYDKDRYEVTGITGAPEGMKYVVADGKVAIAWANATPMNLNAGDIMLSLNMRVKADITEPSPVFTINPGSEFADAQARPLDNFELKMANIKTITGQQDIAMTNYPNPFVTSTTIAYNLPEPGHVSLVLTDQSGKTISTLIDRQEPAGSHTVTVDAAGLNMIPGVYLYKIDYKNASNSFHVVNKMIFTR